MYNNSHLSLYIIWYWKLIFVVKFNIPVVQSIISDSHSKPLIWAQVTNHTTILPQAENYIRAYQGVGCESQCPYKKLGLNVPFLHVTTTCFSTHDYILLGIHNVGNHQKPLYMGRWLGWLLMPEDNIFVACKGLGYCLSIPHSSHTQ